MRRPPAQMALTLAGTSGLVFIAGFVLREDPRPIGAICAVAILVALLGAASGGRGMVPFAWVAVVMAATAYVTAVDSQVGGANEYTSALVPLITGPMSTVMSLWAWKSSSSGNDRRRSIYQQGR